MILASEQTQLCHLWDQSPPAGADMWRRAREPSMNGWTHAEDVLQPGREKGARGNLGTKTRSRGSSAERGQDLATGQELSLNMAG